MQRKLTVTICGGGNLAHAQAAYLARKNVTVNIYTRHPESWTTHIQAAFFDGDSKTVPLNKISSDASMVEESEIVIISLPRFAIEEVSTQLLPHLTDQQLIVYAPGTPWLRKIQYDVRWSSKRLCALYKVPFISRTEKYGHAVSVLGSRNVNRVWLSSSSLRSSIPLLEELFDTPLVELSSVWPFVLTNSNPLLHPSRLVVMFKDYQHGVFYDHNYLFYEEWTQESSELYMAADKELLALCEHCPGMVIGKDIVPVSEYYESPDAEALTRKIRSITAFKGIRSPMIQQHSGWIPDFSSRYFAEDVEWGTEPICTYARELGIETPVLNHFVTWTRDKLTRYST